MGTETEGMAPAEGGVLWHSRSRGRGSHGRQVGPIVMRWLEEEGGRR